MSNSVNETIARELGVRWCTCEGEATPDPKFLDECERCSKLLEVPDYCSSRDLAVEAVVEWCGEDRTRSKLFVFGLVGSHDVSLLRWFLLIHLGVVSPAEKTARALADAISRKELIDA